MPALGIVSSAVTEFEAGFGYTEFKLICSGTSCSTAIEVVGLNSTLNTPVVPAGTVNVRVSVVKSR